MMETAMTVVVLWTLARVLVPFGVLLAIGYVGYRMLRPSVGGAEAPVFDKLADVLRANVNDLLDRAADPMKQLNLLLDDLRAFRRRQVGQIGSAIAAQKQVQADLASASAELDRWTRRAQMLAQVGKDEEAKAAIKHQLRYEELVVTTKQALATTESQVSVLKDDLKTLDEKIEDMDSRRSVYEVRSRTARASAGIHGAISSSGTAPNVSGITDRVEQSLRRQEAQASAAAEIDRMTTQQSSDHAATSGEIEARLAALKAGARGVA